MYYKLRLKSSVLVWSDKEQKYILKDASTDFKFHSASDLSVLVREMALYADDPLDFTISREDD